MFGNPKVLFIYRQYNPCTRVDNGRFVNSEGKVFNFNFDNQELQTIDNILEKCKQMMDKSSSYEVSRQEILKAYRLMSSISNIKITTKLTRCDAGQNSLYAICEENIVELSTKGSYTGYVKFETAQKIYDILKNINFYDIKKD